MDLKIMQMTVSVEEAEISMGRLLEEVEHGATCVITKAGRPVAKLIPFQFARLPRIPGLLKDKLCIADDFDAPLNIASDTHIALDLR